MRALLALLLLLCCPPGWGEPAVSGTFHSARHHYTLTYPRPFVLVTDSRVCDRVAAAYQPVLHARGTSPVEHLDAAFFLQHPSGSTLVPYLTLQVYPIPASVGHDGNKFIKLLFSQASDVYPGWISRHWPVHFFAGPVEWWFGGYDANSPTLGIRVRLYACLQRTSGLVYVFSLTDRQADIRQHIPLFEPIIRSLRFTP